jgi:hypothetical protein
MAIDLENQNMETAESAIKKLSSALGFMDNYT